MEIITRAEAKAQGLKRYFTGKPCKYGHVSERLVSDGKCCECRKKRHKENKDAIAERNREYYKANKEALAEKQREYRKANKEVVAKKELEYYKANKEVITERALKYYKANKDAVAERGREYRKANKEGIAERMLKYFEANPLQRFTRKSLERIEGAIGKGRINRAEVELGYTQEDFKHHIESLWLDGMTWENRSEWHIDHIKPLSLFIKEGVTDPAIINALSNLQPLWAKDNLSKGASYAA